MCKLLIKSNFSSFQWYLTRVTGVTHNWVHCVWRQQCQVTLFASFGEWIKDCHECFHSCHGWSTSILVDLDELKCNFCMFCKNASKDVFPQVIVARIVMCPLTFTDPHLQRARLPFLRKADSDGPYPERIVLPLRGCCVKHPPHGEYGPADR